MGLGRALTPFSGLADVTVLGQLCGLVSVTGVGQA
jgi:hypothetical protein